MPCLLCEDIALHNRFCAEHKSRTPRAGKVATLLGVTAEDIIKHRRHQDCYVIKYPVTSATPRTDENAQSSETTPHDPMTDLQTLRKVLHNVLVQTYREKNVSPGDIVRVTSELRSLIIATEDLQIKLEAARGAKNSAFTQEEMAEVYSALQDLCPVCKVKVCGKITPSC